MLVLSNSKAYRGYLVRFIDGNILNGFSHLDQVSKPSKDAAAEAEKSRDILVVYSTKEQEQLEKRFRQSFNTSKRPKKQTPESDPKQLSLFDDFEFGLLEKQSQERDQNIHSGDYVVDYILIESRINYLLDELNRGYKEKVLEELKILSDKISKIR